MYIYACVFLSVCVCVCLRERDRERERESACVSFLVNILLF